MNVNHRFSILFSDSSLHALAYRITATAEPGLKISGPIRQDDISTLRQQYLDRDIKIPDRGSRWLTGANIRIHADLKKNFAKLETKYTRWVRLTNTTVSVNLSSLIFGAERTPRRNVELAEQGLAPAKESLHQYGCAYDITPIPFYGGDVTIQEDDARKLKEIWEDRLGLVGDSGYNYIKSGWNKIHVQILNYDGILVGVSNP